MNPLFPNLEALILKSAPPHIAVEHAPETLAELNSWADGQRAPTMLLDGRYGSLTVSQANPLESRLPVWNGASDRTIYSSPEVNFAFRAWHDWLHLQLQADVDYRDEYMVARAHRQAALAARLPLREELALWYDTNGQNVYHKHHGKFIEDQRGFVLHCLGHGLNDTIAMEW